jgi:hypothetical protein
MTRTLAAHDGIDQRRRRGGGFLQCCRRLLQVQGDGCGQHLDMANFLGGDVQQHVAVLVVRPARAPGLKEILHAIPDLALDAADGLLRLSCKQRVWVSTRTGY